jgi:hypothetical protein
VTAFIVGFENWTIFSLTNATVIGPGPLNPCTSSAVGYLSPNPAQGLRHGGTSQWAFATGVISDVGLPLGLNGSQLCSSVQNTTYLACGVGAQFDMNFERATGTVDTCSSTMAKLLPIRSNSWPVSAPFQMNGHAYSVPLDRAGGNSPGYVNGTYSWTNYTFPADAGIWQYDDLSQTSSTGAGLVFSYSPCP